MTQETASSDISSDDRLWAAIGYPIALVAIIMLLMEEKKNRPFIKFHAIQAIILSIVLVVLMVILSITVVGAICAPLLWLVTFWPAVEAYRGKYIQLPVIGNFVRNLRLGLS